MSTSSNSSSERETNPSNNPFTPAALAADLPPPLPQPLPLPPLALRQDLPDINNYMQFGLEGTGQFVNRNLTAFNRFLDDNGQIQRANRITRNTIRNIDVENNNREPTELLRRKEYSMKLRNLRRNIVPAKKNILNENTRISLQTRFLRLRENVLLEKITGQVLPQKRDTNNEF